MRDACGKELLARAPLKAAVEEWLANATAAEAKYGHISVWETSAVADFSELFEDAEDFDEDISGWDTSGATSMHGLFDGASSFNQSIGGWDVSNITLVGYMFSHSTSPSAIGTCPASRP